MRKAESSRREAVGAKSAPAVGRGQTADERRMTDDGIRKAGFGKTDEYEWAVTKDR